MFNASPPQPILTATHCGGAAHDLFDNRATRQLETIFAAQLPAHSLMQRAGHSVARLALALCPHAQTLWIACGPGNNGGDGLEAAGHLKRWGKRVAVTWLGSPERCSADTLASFERARQAGVEFVTDPPAEFDFAIDALLGIGASNAAALNHPIERKQANTSQNERMHRWAHQLNRQQVSVLAIDLPSGLNADTGMIGAPSVRAQHTLSLVTLKPGLFTAAGRDHCGDIWFDAIGCDDLAGVEVAPVARLSGAVASERHTSQVRRRDAAHASHKGSFGDVMVIGGAPGMTGAALLAATAALHGGAGRVLVSLLDDSIENGATSLDAAQPELMFRRVESLDFGSATVVCGCGGGSAVRQHLPRVLSTAAAVVLDADALNAIAIDVGLQAQLKQRAARGRPSVLTPHPLEAARLLGCSTGEIQADRLAAAREIANRFACCVALKGSGTVIAAPGRVPHINPTGNALLATAGTGDVLAGLIGASLGKRVAGLGKPQAARDDAKAVHQAVFETTCDVVFRHGEAASRWPESHDLTASALAHRL